MEYSDIVAMVAEIAKQREKVYKLQKVIDYLRKRIQERKGQTDVYRLQEL